MKSKIFSTLSCFFFLFTISACSQVDGLKNVQIELGTLEVSAIPGHNYNFIARKQDGSVWYAFSSGTSAIVSDIVCIIPPK